VRFRSISGKVLVLVFPKWWISVYTATIRAHMDYDQNPQTSQIPSSQHKMSEAKRLTWSKFHTLSPEILRATGQNSVLRDLYTPDYYWKHTKSGVQSYIAQTYGARQNNHMPCLLLIWDFQCKVQSLRMITPKPHFTSESVGSDNHNIAWDVTSSSTEKEMWRYTSKLQWPFLFRLNVYI
jgi:hypothetical protein